MSEDVPNLMSALYPWAHRQGENFTTESLVWMLRMLLVHAPEQGMDLLSWLCFGQVDQLRLPVKICTQHTIDEGRPDISVEAPGILVFIEVKTVSSLGHDQVARYLGGLARRRDGRLAALVLLTRDDPELTDEQKQSVRCVRWYEVAQRLSKLSISGREASMAVEMFTTFLKERVMTLEPVDWQLIGGIQAIQSLALMIGEALKAANIPIYKRTGGHTWLGWYIGSNSMLWAGVSYSEPSLIKVAFDKVMADKAKFDAQGTGEWLDGEPRWAMDLNSESVHFFSRTADSQLACLTDFFRQAYPQACACLPSEERTV
jgi:hypothetical protein